MFLSTKTQRNPLVVSSSKAMALIGVFAALYIVTAGVVGSLLGPVAQGYPEHFLRGLLMAALVVRTRHMWSATLMGLVSGLVFAFAVPSPYPSPFLLVSTFVSGLVFDLALVAGRSYVEGSLSRIMVMVSSGVSGVAESVTLLSFLTFGGFLKALSPNGLSFVWASDLTLNIVLSLLGSFLAFRFMSTRLPSSIPSKGVSTEPLDR